MGTEEREPYLDELETATVADALQGTADEDSATPDQTAPHWIIPPVAVPADTMPWDYRDPRTGDKKVVYPQKGRTVHILPVQASELNLLLGEFQTAQSMIERGENKPQLLRAGMALATRTTRSIARVLSNMVVDWDLIGWDGRPLPKPYQNPAVLLDLPTDAMGWLSNMVGRATMGTLQDLFSDRKKDSRRSTGRSATTARRRSG